MKILLIFACTFQWLLSQEIQSLDQFVEQYKSFYLDIHTYSISYKDGLVEKSDSSSSVYRFDFKKNSDDNFIFDVNLKYDKEHDYKTQNQWLPEFSGITMTVSPFGKLIHIDGLNRIEKEIGSLLDQLISERGLVNNEKAVYLKYLVTNPKIIKTLYFRQPLRFFEAFQHQHIKDLNIKKDVKLKNPIGKEALDATQIKTFIEEGNNFVYSISQKIDNLDISDKLNHTNGDEFIYDSKLNYHSNTTFLIDRLTKAPFQMENKRNVRFSNQIKVNILSIKLRSKL